MTYDNGSDNCLVRLPHIPDQAFCHQYDGDNFLGEPYDNDTYRIKWENYEGQTIEKCILSLPYDIIAVESYQGLTFPIHKKYTSPTYSLITYT